MKTWVATQLLKASGFLASLAFRLTGGAPEPAHRRSIFRREVEDDGLEPITGSETLTEEARSMLAPEPERQKEPEAPRPLTGSIEERMSAARSSSKL